MMLSLRSGFEKTRGSRALLLAATAWAALGCDDGRARADVVTGLDSGPGADAAPSLDAVASPDAAPPGDAAAPLDAAPPSDGAPPADLGPVEPEVCDGLDNDGDGVIDNGVSNACGGCGGIPPEGCQSWKIDVSQGEDGRLDVNHVVGLQTALLGFSERRIEGADCVFYRVPGVQHPDAHLGLVNVTTRHGRLNQVPTYDENRGFSRYSNSPEDLPPMHLYDPGDSIDFSAGGGRAVGMFELSMVAPAELRGVTEADLEPVAALARGEAGAGVRLTWSPASGDADPAMVRLFIGGSAPVFNRNVYLARRHYELSARLADDGEVELSPELFAGGVPMSALWIKLSRVKLHREPMGAHSVDLLAGQFVELRRGGALEADEPAPFDILEPSPNVREVAPGEPLHVAWSAPPEGSGPLAVSLNLYDAAQLEQRLVTCTVDDPATGAIELPADLTERWPSGEGDARQLSVSWTYARTPLPAPDVGEMGQAVTLILRLEP